MVTRTYCQKKPRKTKFLEGFSSEKQKYCFFVNVGVFWVEKIEEGGRTTSQTYMSFFG